MVMMVIVVKSIILITSGCLFTSDLDASGKPQSGLFWGNTGWLGSYGECTESIPDALYCLADLAFPHLSFTITELSST